MNKKGSAIIIGLVGLSLIGLLFFMYNILTPATIVTPVSQIPNSEDFRVFNQIEMFGPGGICQEIERSNIISQQFKLSNGRDIERVIGLSPKLNIKQSTDCSGSTRKTSKLDSSYYEFYCTSNGKTTLIKKVLGSEFFNFGYVFDINVGSCQEVKIISSLDALMVDRTEASGGEDKTSVSHDVVFTMLPFTFKKNLPQLNVDTAKTIKCDNSNEYCSFKVNGCKTLKYSSTKFQCDFELCEGFYQNSEVTVVCEVPAVGKTPVLSQKAHSQNAFCTESEICSVGSFICSAEGGLKECKDLNGDNCGDEYQIVKDCLSEYQGRATCNANTGSCDCRDDLTCSNGVSPEQKFCSNNNVQRCTIDSDTCQESVIVDAVCSAPQSCDPKTNSCQCVNSCSIGDRRLSQLGGNYDECIAKTPCNEWKPQQCPVGSVYDAVTKTCECSETIDSCNEEYLHGTVRCSVDGNSREQCVSVSGAGSAKQCWEYAFLDSNPRPDTRSCEAGQYSCKQSTCNSAECSPDARKIAQCETSLDTQCPTLGQFENCQPDFLCSTNSKRCEPQHQCDPNNPDNGKFTRCSPESPSEVQKCIRGADGVNRWQDVPSLSCESGEICTSGSDAQCTLAYNLVIQSLDTYAVKKPIANVEININSATLPVGNIIIIACVENQELGCTDETKYTGLVQMRTDGSGKTPKISFNEVPNTASWYITAYVKDYKEATIKSKLIHIKKRLDLDVSIPVTNFINQEISATYRVTDIDSGEIVIPTVDIFLTMNDQSVPYIPVGVNGFKFTIDKVGTVKYRLDASKSGFLSDTEEGFIEVQHPIVETVFKVDGTDIKSIPEFKVSSGNRKIEILVTRGIQNMRIDTSSLRMRNPAQGPNEGQKLNFVRDSNNKYVASYNFAEPGKTYYLEGTFTIIETGEVVPIEKTFNTQSGTKTGEGTFLDPKIIIGLIAIGAVVIGGMLFLIFRRK